MFLFSAILAAFSSEPVFSSDSTDEFEIAFAIREKDPLAARQILENLPVQHPHFKSVAEEVLKIAYASEDWPSFFSWMRDYKRRWSPRERSKVVILEALALLRHCQTELVEAVADFYRNARPEFADAMEQIKALSRIRFQGKAAEKSEWRPLQSRLQGVSLWKMNAESTKDIHPRVLKVRVANRCR